MTTEELIKEADSEYEQKISAFFKRRYLELKNRVESTNKSLEKERVALSAWTYEEAKKTYRNDYE